MTIPWPPLAWPPLKEAMIIPILYRLYRLYIYIYIYYRAGQYRRYSRIDLSIKAKNQYRRYICICICIYYKNFKSICNRIY